MQVLKMEVFLKKDIKVTYKENQTQGKKRRRTKKKQGKYVFIVDFQAVLMTPTSNVSTLDYYKTKLQVQVYNFCFYNIVNGKVFCYLWNETEGGENAEEFASI